LLSVLLSTEPPSLQLILELGKSLAADDCLDLDIDRLLETVVDNAGIFIEPEAKAAFRMTLQRGIAKDDTVRKLSAQRIRTLWMGRITSSVRRITEFSMAPSLVPRIERMAWEIANFTCVNLAVHGETYNRIIAGAMVV
jgi:hypothetical protein